jgi:seryl-tRNA synthetase
MSHNGSHRLESVAHSLLQPTSVNGVYARTALFEQVIESLSGLINRHRAPGTETLKFPPVISREHLERSGYLHSFPHLLGCVSCLHGEESDIRTLVEGRDSEREWISGLSATDLVLTPAACYPVYPLAAARGRVPAKGLVFDVASYCFRRERTYEIDRLQAFEMREWVCVGSAEQAVEFRGRLTSWAEGLAKRLGLPYKIAPASDPFFGRAGKLMASSQLEQSLKFELLIPVHSEELPTACMSFNYHRDHFGTTWDLMTEAGELAHTACVAFGMDRFALALFATHGLDLQSWPLLAREILWPDNSRRKNNHRATTYKNGSTPGDDIALRMKGQ